MTKTLIIATIFFVFSSCKNDRGNDNTDADSVFDITTEKWPKKRVVNSKSSQILKNWPEFIALETRFDAIYSVENTEDLRLILEDLIANQKLMTDSEYPEPFDKAQIKSRQRVFQTFLLKTKGNLKYRSDVQQSTVEMIEAYNSLLNQFDVITNNTFDIKTLLDEK